MSALKHCPKCGHSLRGLPIPRTCPACGWANERAPVTIRLRAWHRPDLLLVIGLMLIAATGVALTSAHELDTTILIGLAWLLILGTGLAVYIVRARWNGHRVVISHAGVLFEAPAVPLSLVPWSEIGEAKFDRSARQFRLYTPDGTPLVICEADDLGSERLADRCAATINASRAVYAPGSATDGPPGHEERSQAVEEIRPRSVFAPPPPVVSRSLDHHHKNPSSHDSSTHTSSS